MKNKTLTQKESQHCTADLNINRLTKRINKKDNTVSNFKTQAKQQTPFGNYAEYFHSLGLNVFPLKEGTKIPSIKWKPLQKARQSLNMIKQLQNSHPNGNIAFVTGEISGITVVDVDDAKLSLDVLFNTFGETPLVIKTPGQGLHLYYKYNGECTCTGFNGWEKIDIRGEGGGILLPPSFNPKHNKSYKVLQGEYSLIGNLPPMKEIKIPEPSSKATINNSLINEGNRNNVLFTHLCNIAKKVDTEDGLYNEAQAFNIKNNPPLDAKEVKATCKQVWKYKIKHCLYNNGTRGVFVNMGDLELKAGVLWLLCLLKINHKIGDTFAIAPKGITQKYSFSSSTIARYRNTLVEKGYIKLVQQGGKHRHDPNKYQFV